MAVASGCGDAALRATRYKAERLLWLAERAEKQARLDEDEGIDSTEALQVRESYLRLPKEVRIPRVTGDASDSTRRVAQDIARLVVTSSSRPRDLLRACEAAGPGDPGPGGA